MQEMKAITKTRVRRKGVEALTGQSEPKGGHVGLESWHPSFSANSLLIGCHWFHGMGWLMGYRILNDYSFHPSVHP